MRGEQLGYLLLARRGDEPFEPADVKELGLVVTRIALAVDNGRLYCRTQEQVRRLRRLHEVTAALAGTLDVDRVVGSLASAVVAEVPVDGVAVYLAGKRGLELAAHAGTVGDVPAEIPDHTAQSWPDDQLVLMGVGGPPVGALLLTGNPPPGTEPAEFLQHLADLGSLVIGKSLLFERIRTQAESDPLTGLPNRALLMQRLESAVTRCRETGSDLAVIFVDLDDFKAVNDTYGHDIGDQLLVAAAARLTDVAGPSDTVSRLGGDEFVLVRVDVTDSNEALATADQIRAVMSAPFELGDITIANGASVGIAMASTSGYHPKTLMRDADAGMYADKVRERDRPQRMVGRAADGAVPMAGSRPGPPQLGPISMVADNLRAWCETSGRAAGQGLSETAREAVERTLAIVRRQVELDLTWLSRFIHGRQRYDAFDGDPAPFEISRKTVVALCDTYCVRVLRGDLPAVIPDTHADERTNRLPITHQQHVGAYVGVPVFAGDDRLYGMLCAVSRDPRPSLRDRDAKVLGMMAGVVAEPITADLVRDVRCSAFLRNAESMLAAGGMSVDLQPIVDLATGGTASVEALARFATYPYSVEDWFAQAHQAGCGEQMEMDAALLAHGFLDLLPRSLTLAINASPDVACSPEFLNLVTSADPTRVVVEITEHRPATRPSLLGSSIRRLQAQGVQVAIDDAGTGFTDLRQIIELQPDIIKLDRGLISRVESDPVKLALVQAFVAFAKNTGLQLVAEGVGSESTKDLLRELGVDYGQGYALSRPEPAAALIARLQDPPHR
jgi:diguanylate cyclase (GGDEF)-like protein